MTSAGRGGTMTSCSARSSSRRSSSSARWPSPARRSASSISRSSLVDAERKATPVPRHALLISDNPASAPPRRVVTALDGTADVRLRPGNYTVESDRPVAFQGKAYQWTQIVDIVAGRDAVLELTADNAEVEPSPPRRRLRGAVGGRPLVPPASMAGQRRRALDADHPRVGIRDRREGAHRDEPAGHRHRDVGRSAALAGRQSGGAASSRRIRRGTSPSSGSIRRSPHRCGPCRSDARKRRSRPSRTGRSSSRSARRSASRRA